MSKQRYGYCQTCMCKLSVPEGASVVQCPHCMMTLRIGGTVVEVSGHSAEEVRSVAVSMAETLMKECGSHPPDGADKATGDGQMERSQVDLPVGGQALGTEIFISHSTQDVKWIESELIPLLKDAGLVPWYSKDDIRTAEYWERQILAALNRCAWFLIVLSPRSAASEWVKDELHWAIANRENRIIPVLIGQCELHDFHIRLSRIEFANWLADREKARKRIIDVVCRGGSMDPGDSTKATPRRWWEFWK